MKNYYTGETIDQGVKELAAYMKSSDSIVILTGAGMDTESNIPDFRSEGGWWRKIDPRTVANIDTFAQNYTLFHEFYSMRIKLLQDVLPHAGHFILADFEQKGVIKSIATQNISGLHRMAGSQNVHELHGNIATVRCNSCGQPAKTEDFLHKNNCTSCSATALRPNVVLFGEALPQNVWAQALSDIQRADLLVVIGTSLEVAPVNQLPLQAKGRTVFINKEDSGVHYNFDLTILGKAKEVMEKLKGQL
ncbi:SIR2 family NAD-dependent protein deacylase [Dethiobacter alkaliphilus]|uniref:SIR2 family NAD-dependent protein deacylase n=1 Tax=Dethiobacter alkaliphilus TaxID=427926 RepID=UPI0022260544|nr:NAD-dependent deacylase [Dethiobacter alkaliphilus]MCW3490477.1 NAD-dependent deacylase [Dethiobacter alkaliphilus]